MRNWEVFVRERLQLPAHSPMRETRIIRELAAQIEDFYREAIARGASEAEADMHACAQIRDWQELSRDLARADRANSQPRMDRIADTVTDLGADACAVPAGYCPSGDRCLGCRPRWRSTVTGRYV